MYTFSRSDLMTIIANVLHISYISKNRAFGLTWYMASYIGHKFGASKSTGCLTVDIHWRSQSDVLTNGKNMVRDSSR